MLMLNDADKVKEVAKKFKTPFYMYDANKIRRQYELLNESMGGYTDIFYSIKANPNLSICGVLRDAGAGAEVCSEIELLAALKVGFKANNIIFVGPAKSDNEIRLCLRHRIYAIVCESITEYERIDKIADELNVIARVALRINPDFYSKSALLKMGGKPSQFGIDEKIVFDNIDYFNQQNNIKLIGMHVYNGTRILEAESVYQNTKEVLALARKFSEVFEIKLEMVDIGGGLGIPYHANESFLDMAQLRKWMVTELQTFKRDYPKTRIILESGRFLVAQSGSFVSRVIDVKSSKGENFLVTDGGTNCHMAAVGIGSALKRNFPIRSISCHQDISHKTEKKYHITGPLCTPGDLIGKDVILEEVHEGDLIIIDHSGAYGPTASPVFFLSHGYPAEILLDHDNIHLIRTPDNANDIFKNQLHYQFTH